MTRATITIRETGIELEWDEPLPEDAHTVSKVEAMAAGAILGIGTALTGKGRSKIVQEMIHFARNTEVIGYGYPIKKRVAKKR